MFAACYPRRMPLSLASRFRLDPLASAANPLSPLRSSAAAFSSSSRSPPFPPLQFRRLKPNYAAASLSPASVAGDTGVDKAKLAQVKKRLEKASRHFKAPPRADVR